MMKSRPRLRTYAIAAGSIAVESSIRSGLTTDRPAHSVPHHDVLVSKSFLERRHRQVSSHFSKRHCSARANLAVLARANDTPIVEDVRQHRNSAVAAQHSIRLEKGNLLGKSSFANFLR